MPKGGLYTYNPEAVSQMKFDDGQRKPLELVGRGRDGQSRPSELVTKEALIVTERLSSWRKEVLAAGRGPPVGLCGQRRLGMERAE